MALPKRKGKAITAGGEFSGDPGDMPHRVTIQAKPAAESRNDLNEDTREFADVITVWANVKAAGALGPSGREFWQGDQSRASAEYTVTIRYYAGLTTLHRLKWGAKILNIASIANPDGVKEFLQLQCVEEAEATPNRGY